MKDTSRGNTISNTNSIGHTFGPTHSLTHSRPLLCCSNLGHRGAFLLKYSCCGFTSCPEPLPVVTSAQPGAPLPPRASRASEGVGASPLGFHLKTTGLNACVSAGASGKSLLFIHSFPRRATHVRRSGSAPEIASVVHHVITSSPKSVPPPPPPPILFSTTPTHHTHAHAPPPRCRPHLGHSVLISVVCVACAGMKRKGKRCGANTWRGKTAR